MCTSSFLHTRRSQKSVFRLSSEKKKKEEAWIFQTRADPSISLAHTMQGLCREEKQQASQPWPRRVRIPSALKEGNRIGRMTLLLDKPSQSVDGFTRGDQEKDAPCIVKLQGPRFWVGWWGWLWVENLAGWNNAETRRRLRRAHWLHIYLFTWCMTHESRAFLHLLGGEDEAAVRERSTSGIKEACRHLDLSHSQCWALLLGEGV
jgi:hypothetical protein